jgi:endonuclease YncB( thermonuclease family)
MVWKLKSSLNQPRRPRRSLDAALGLLVVLTMVVLGFGLDRVARYLTGPTHVAGASPRVFIPSSARSDIVVIDGDTVRFGGTTFRLVGFDTPERGERAPCDRERELAEKAASRLRALIAGGELALQPAACACAAGTYATQACNFGQSCAYLRVGGKDVGETLMREGLAQAFVCSQTGCPPRPRWC